MGSSQSRPHSEAEKVFQRDTPISFSPDVVNRLSDQLESTSTPSEHQSILDAHIRARINDELEHLKKEEEYVRREVERALERENLDREKAMAGDASTEDGSSAGNVKNTAALLGDMEEIKAKIEKYQSKKESSAYLEVQASVEAVVECYRKNNETPLNCSTEVGRFKAAVERLEQVQCFE